MDWDKNKDTLSSYELAMLKSEEIEVPKESDWIPQEITEEQEYYGPLSFEVLL